MIHSDATLQQAVKNRKNLTLYSSIASLACDYFFCYPKSDTQSNKKVSTTL
ncbi:hypothetical protein DMR_41720 [Solidesulfovibrio magneticus RS-1]|uniref:Uncharacterized protein n=1 Tax=Solidesulfovibrio magneticus (strain ATCC 700980 / DSM 13731 / RS-1) TaxID=573370 RepID=C4XPW3_SOLM1|nr:hypothetical protein DMR_41720 [Solidesulfovibrio magneticus RS-1]